MFDWLIQFFSGPQDGPKREGIWPHEGKPSFVTPVEPKKIEDFPGDEYAERVFTKGEVNSWLKDAKELLFVDVENRFRQKEPEFLKKFQDHHTKDCEHYSVDLKTIGDFISILVKRNGWMEPDRCDLQSPNRTACLSLNLLTCGSISFIPGRDIDSNGQTAVCFLEDEVKREEPSFPMFRLKTIYKDSLGSHLTPVSTWERRYVSARYGKPDFPGEKLLVKHSDPCSCSVPKKQRESELTIGGIRYNDLVGGWCPEHIKGVPRPADDDRIVFQGTGTVLYAPFGLGQKVYERILEAAANRNS